MVRFGYRKFYLLKTKTNKDQRSLFVTYKGAKKVPDFKNSFCAYKFDMQLVNNEELYTRKYNFHLFCDKIKERFMI